MNREHNERPPFEGAGHTLQAVRFDQGAELFVEDLRRQEIPLFSELQRLLQRPDKPPRVAALGIYLDTMLKTTVFDVDPFAPRFPGDEEHQADRRAIVRLATAQLAQDWVEEHPESQAGRAVVRLNVSAPTQDHQELIRELWPTFIAAMSEPSAAPLGQEPK